MSITERIARRLFPRHWAVIDMLREQNSRLQQMLVNLLTRDKYDARE